MKPKTELKAIAPKIQSASADWYTQTFQTLNAGATFVLDAFPAFYRQTLFEMKGIFSRGELMMVIDVLNGHGTLLIASSGSGELVGQHLWLELFDSFRLYPGIYEEKWKITDKDAFLERISALPRFGKVCLEIWAAGFWERHETIDIKEYCAQLL